jgi:hypothetical protein
MAQGRLSCCAIPVEDWGGGPSWPRSCRSHPGLARDCANERTSGANANQPAAAAAGVGPRPRDGHLLRHRVRYFFCLDPVLVRQRQRRSGASQGIGDTGSSNRWERPIRPGTRIDRPSSQADLRQIRQDVDAGNREGWRTGWNHRVRHRQQSGRAPPSKPDSRSLIIDGTGPESVRPVNSLRSEGFTICRAVHRTAELAARDFSGMMPSGNGTASTSMSFVKN